MRGTYLIFHVFLGGAFGILVQKKGKQENLIAGQCAIIVVKIDQNAITDSFLVKYITKMQKITLLINVLTT